MPINRAYRLGNSAIIACLLLTSHLAYAVMPDGMEMPPLAPGGVPAAASSNQVEIGNFSFSPVNLTVVAGTKVTWTNHDDIPHTVVSDDDPRLFKSPPLDTDDAYSFTFQKPGTYRYFCSVHPKMVGTIIVKAP
ncbi:cupredoxin family copper-binding protein [Dongia soli]|uniref:Cupredoxin family copper-binding protein n=1 Tax=Dongia soli TaxID=600628 RepID=A0ABU5EA03_9PROT|nr:cupredoxin family copper-binding protein [Dongia soli]MDY0883168.1 cupredoxin family copper-binding protein [Dongia soli]